MAGTIAVIVLRAKISQMKSNDNRNANRVLAGTVKELSVAPEVVVHPPYDSLPLQLGMQVDAIIQVFCSDEGNAKCKNAKMQNCQIEIQLLQRIEFQQFSANISFTQRWLSLLGDFLSQQKISKIEGRNFAMYFSLRVTFCRKEEHPLHGLLDCRS